MRPTRFIERVRAVEANQFERWYRVTSGRRTRTVGFLLLAGSLVLAGVAAAGLLPNGPLGYLVFGGLLLIGTLSLGLAGPSARPMLVRVGEALVLGSAIAWMYWAVGSRLDVGFGLGEFIIGIVGLALLRSMRPVVAAVVFPALAGGYAVTLLAHAAFDLTAIINAVLLSAFAVIWAIRSFNSRVTDFRNGQLIEQINRQNAQLVSIALQDQLTGLPNRRYFDQAVDLRWEDASRALLPQVLCLFDIDHFKNYNDKYGHPRGDLCLQSVGRVLAAALGADGVCCRLGGEEFAVLCEGVVLEQGVAIAQRLIDSVRDETEVTVSAGVSQAMPVDDSPDELYRVADEALYRAKTLGRDRVEAARVDRR